MFQPFGERLAAKGIAVFGLDLRGFGNSKEPDLPRGDTRDFKRHLQDLDEVVCKMRGDSLLRRIYLMGSSLGGLYVLWYGAHYPDSPDGLILASPAVEVKPKMSPEIREKLPLLMASKPDIMLGTTQGNEADEKSWIPKAFLNDPLRTKCFSARYVCGIGAVLMGDKVFANAVNVKKPTLVLQGDSDVEALPSGAKKLFEKLVLRDKALVMFHTSDHILHDVAGSACSAILDWVSLH
jgi:acylglycerol lipase